MPLIEIAQINLGRGKLGDGQSAAEWLRSGDPALRERAMRYCCNDVQIVKELHQVAQTTDLLLPPRARDLDTVTYRLWISSDGSAWQLAEEDGRVLDQERWME